MLAFFPLNDGSRPVRALYWGGHAGMGTANCTYNELTHLHALYSDSTNWYFSAKRQYPVSGHSITKEGLPSRGTLPFAVKFLQSHSSRSRRISHHI